MEVVKEGSMDGLLRGLMLDGHKPSMELLDGPPKVNRQLSLTQRRSHPEVIPIDMKEDQGLWNVRAMLFLCLWYFFSFCTLFLNKYILTDMKGDPTILGACQMLMTTTCGFIQLYIPCGMYKKVHRIGKPVKFMRNMILVGSMRLAALTYISFSGLSRERLISYCYFCRQAIKFSTVVLGLVALKYVAVSFTETIKSSAPLFTVFISRAVVGEQSGLYVISSTIPIMGGLILCSAAELSYDTRGFLAAMAANLTEWQNVYSKMLISGEMFKYTPAELQFYTSIASIAVQLPMALLFIDLEGVIRTTDLHLFLAFLLNGVFFHFQSITAYVLMDYISPVTHSVANTAKRALLIWLSVLTFHNEVTTLSGLGTLIVFIGVALYNQAREYERKLRLREQTMGHHL
ncbi:unnamed protein product [Darwinula stevensoni]|uniref:Sugar phosphate transporter domain-containing protein n=1 Tax=Darwinula stevensoni TaxID=69355 RepID=A0A7R8XFE4_9CRUS|nr:unnamed protein product [Darwinula stevensoni]CAG0890616.1 unnamed protein product [Darwinula stevensoni]